MVAIGERSFWQGRRVLLTGHTGFKGAWLSLWLSRLGAEVHGLALDPPSEPNLFDVAAVGPVLAADERGDIREAAMVERAVRNARPEVIFHLAAQSLVRESYERPLETLATNVMGTAHVLQSARAVQGLRAIVVVTTDKCYENREWVYPYREVDPLGGKDVYSASKASAELVAASYRSSFYQQPAGAQIATARAGNVIGGGDWARDRLVPDCVRAFTLGKALELRYPEAVRPWQHVLDPLAGYLALAEALCRNDAVEYAQAWNFGPDLDSHATVAEVAREVASFWGPAAVTLASSQEQPHEASLLQLDSTKARTRLRWRPVWSLREALKASVEWYFAWHAREDMHAFSLRQIAAFERGAR